MVCLDFDILCSWDELSNAFSWIHASYIHIHKNSLYVTIYMRHIHVKQSIHFIFLKKFLTMYLKSLELECWAHFMLVLGWISMHVISLTSDVVPLMGNKFRAIVSKVLTQRCWFFPSLSMSCNFHNFWFTKPTFEWFHVVLEWWPSLNLNVA